MRKKLFLCILLACAGCLVFADSRIARLYFDEARKLGESGDTKEALLLLESAFVFRPVYTDAFLLKSKLLAENRENRLRALEAARAAFESGAWEYYPRGEGRLHLAGLYTDLRRYKEALALLDTREKTEVPGIREYELRLRCLRGLNDKKGLDECLKAALGTFPEEQFFLEMYFKTTDPLLPQTVRRFELARLDPARNLKAIAAYIIAAGNADNARQHAWDYFRAGGSDPEVSAMLIEKGLADPAREMERFVSFDGLKNAGLLRRLSTALRFSRPDLVADFLKFFKGTTFLDRDGDGIPEEKFLLENGKLLLWDIDENQDGLDEVTLGFTEDTSMPARLVYRGRDSSFSCFYADYPWVSTAVYSEGAKTYTYSLLTGALGLPCISGFAPQAKTGWLAYSFTGDPLDTQGVHGAAFLCEERDSREKDYRRLVYLTEGKIRQIDIVYGDKEIVINRQIFDGGRFSYGLRDLARRGVFDVREFYEDGKLKSVRVDTKGEGREDYRETFLPDSIKEWDIAGNGSAGIREIQIDGFLPLRIYGGLE